MFFGTISPITMCTTTTSDSANVNEIAWSTFDGISTNDSIADSISVAIAGSATKPKPSDAIVMPSWAPAS